MVSLSNGSLSTEVSNKRPLENGCMPKFKPRKVSAIRNFPPGCGPNALPMNLRTEEIRGGEAGSKDAIGVVSLEPTNTVIEMLDTLMEKAKDSVTVSQTLVMGNGSVGTKISDEAESHGQEAVNNPVEIERNEQLGAYVGNVETAVLNGLPNEVQEVMLEQDLVGVDIVNDVKTPDHSGGPTVLEELKEDNHLASIRKSGAEVAMSPSNANVSIGKDLLPGNPLLFSATCGSIHSGTSIRPRDKYRPRRVSAVRDFPPNCGTNVSLSNEGEKEMATPGKDNLNGTEAVELMPEPTMPIDVSEREVTGEMLTTSGECLDGLHNVHVEIENSGTLNDGAGKGLLGEITVATAEEGMMEFEECSMDYYQHGITEKTGAREGSGTISKAPVSIEDARGPVGEEIAVFSPDINEKDRPPHSDFSFWDNSNRELVHGLMAAPNCPWRKSKGAFNSSAGLKTKQQHVPLHQKPMADALNSNLEANSSGYIPYLENASPNSHDGDGTPGKSTFTDEGDHGAGGAYIHEATPISMFKPDVDNNDNVCSPGDSDEGRDSQNSFGSKDDVNQEIVHGVMAAPHCPWRKERTTTNPSGGTSRGNKRKQNFSWRQKAKAVARRSKPERQSSVSSSKKDNKVHMSNDVDGGPDDLALDEDEDLATNYSASRKQECEMSLPHFGPKNSGCGDARNRVRETLRSFNAICRKLLQQEEANPTEGRKAKRIDLITARVLKDKNMLVNTTKRVGPVPGVEVGDEFQYRVELAVVGIHYPYQSGIDSVKVDDVPLATSIVTSGAYYDDVENADVLRYSGQGGNIVGKCKMPEDQKLERGNLALANSIKAKTPVRVVRGWKEMKFVDPLDAKPKLITTYVYDGLYTVTSYSTEKGPHGKQVFMFELKRNPGQPELAWKELKKSSSMSKKRPGVCVKKRPGVCVTDISEGKERIPIWAVNTVDNDKPPPFTYISKMMYPDWYQASPPEGCGCVGKCSIKKRCRCIIKNGGEIPYNRNGALVETKTLVYECGPHCKCPPSCYNRSTQRGIKFQLEIFKTESRGWGVRALTSITSGSFICEYTGELLEDKEAEKRIGNDEYLFDIANPEDEEAAAEYLKEGGGFTIDAKTYGSVGRFINHSCAPNLWAQNVIFDNNDKRMPHVMLFAMENIPPLTELTYSYNYSLGQISDAEGNIKVKKCYCGATGCSGRMY